RRPSAGPARRVSSPTRRTRLGAPRDGAAARRREGAGTGAGSPPGAGRGGGARPRGRARRSRTGQEIPAVAARRARASAARPSPASGRWSLPRGKPEATSGPEVPKAALESTDRRLRSCLLLGWGAGELAAQGATSARQLALGRPGRDVQGDGDLLVGVTPDVVEHQDLAEALGKGLEGAAHVHLPLGAGAREGAREAGGRKAPRLCPRPDVLAGAVHDDSREPRTQGGAAAEAAEPLKSPAPRLLEHVSRVGVAAAEQPDREAEEDRRVAPVQLAKRGLVAPGKDSFDELEVGVLHQGAWVSPWEEPRGMTIIRASALPGFTT